MSNLGSFKFNLPELGPSTMPVGSGAANGAVTTGSHTRSFFNPDNPALWLVGLGAVTLGLIAASTSVRLGPLRLSASAGKS